MDKSDIISYLKEDDHSALQELLYMADTVRKENVGDAVHLRGLIEISNYCIKECTYCGINSDNRKIERYRMTEGEIMASVHMAVDYGFGTIVFQSGEDYGIKCLWIARIIRRIKLETDLAVALSLGERSTKDLTVWRQAGADRYLLKFETSDKKLYQCIHPPLNGRTINRLAILETLRALGYEVGSGIMIGIPGQSYESLADDLILFHDLDLDMVAVGPYIVHPDTPLGRYQNNEMTVVGEEQVPNTELMTLKVLALTRILCPEANIPSTTALATIDAERGRELGLMHGANVVMPNLTPERYRKKYEIYPGKYSPYETTQTELDKLFLQIKATGMKIGKGQGGRKRRSH